MNVASEVVLVSVYAGFLMLCAVGLDLLAQHSQARSDRYRTAGFRYHPQQDVWVCPQDQMLWPVLYDDQLRLMRYRAKPSVCNACPVRTDCTTSPHGREVSRSTQPWPQSEAARFHRGIVLVMVGLAVLLLVTAAFRHHEASDLLALALPLTACVVLAHRFTEHFRRSPSGFPVATASTGLRVAPASRTRWASDARKTP